MARRSRGPEPRPRLSSLWVPLAGGLPASSRCRVHEVDRARGLGLRASARARVRRRADGPKGALDWALRQRMTDTNDPALEALLAEARAQFAQGLPGRAGDL